MPSHNEAYVSIRITSQTKKKRFFFKVRFYSECSVILLTSTVLQFLFCAQLLHKITYIPHIFFRKNQRSKTYYKVKILSWEKKLPIIIKEFLWNGE